MTDQFDHLRDPEPPEPRDETLASVRQRAGQIRRRGRSIPVLGAGLLVVAVVAVGLAVGSGDDATLNVTDGMGTTTTSIERDLSPGEAVQICFPEPFSSTAPPTREQRVPLDGWPDDLPSLLVLAGNGELWVLDNGEATRWTTTSSEGPAAPGYLWARWDNDGTILATRLVDSPYVSLERLSAPGDALVAAELGFTVSPDAPSGYCPIDGYLTTFGVGPEGVVLVRHSSGPIPHSCPLMAPESTATTSEWRCSSPESVGFEIREGDLAQPGVGTGLTVGGQIELVADSSQSAAFAFDEAGSLTVVRPGEEPECCYGGQTGSAFSLSPDGRQVAYTPDGRQLAVVDVGPTTEARSPVWESSDEITATAFADGWIAVAHGNTLSLVSSDGAEVHDLTGLGVPTIATLDWSR